MTQIRNKSNEFFLTNTSGKDQKETNGHGGDDMENVEVAVTDRMYVMPVENETAVSTCVTNACDYRQSDLFVRIKRIKNSEITQRDSCLSQVTRCATYIECIPCTTPAAHYQLPLPLR